MNRLRTSLCSVLAVCAGVLSLASCRTEVAESHLIPIVRKAVYDSNSVWHNRLRQIPSDLSSLPIGIFASGLDGLAVLEAFLTADYFDNITGAETPDGIADFAGEDFSLLVDDANGYYGYYVDSSRIDLLRELAVRDALFLLGRNYFILRDDDLATGIKRVSKVVISSSEDACYYAGGDIDTLLQLSGSGVRHLGLLDCGIDALVRNLPHGNACAVGILSGSELYLSKDYDERVRLKAMKEGVSDVIQFFSENCAGMEEAVSANQHYVYPMAFFPRSDYRGPVLGEENGCIEEDMMDRYNFSRYGNELVVKHNGRRLTEVQLNSVGNYARFSLVSLIERHRRSGSRIPIENVIVGNKSYPYVIDTLRKVVSELYDYKRDGQYIYRNSLSGSVNFINPMEYLVKETYRHLRSTHGLALRTRRSHLASFITVPDLRDSLVKTDEQGNFTSQFKFGRQCGTEERFAKVLPLSPAYLDSTVFTIAEQLCPESIKLLKKQL